VLELNVAEMEPSKDRARLCHHREFVAMFVVMNQYQQLYSDNVTFQGV